MHHSPRLTRCGLSFKHTLNDMCSSVSPLLILPHHKLQVRLLLTTLETNNAASGLLSFLSSKLTTYFNKTIQTLSGMANADTTVGILACCLICLIVLLLFLYKKLNKEADGKYTIQNIMYKKGGVRDRVREAVTAVESRLGVQLWPHSDEEGEEMESMEGGEASCSHQGDDTDGEDEQDQDSEGQSGSRQEDEGDKSSLCSSAGERDRLLDKLEENNEREEKQEEPPVKTEPSGTGLQIDLKQFSGSAIWSEEGGEGTSNDVTML